mmetsp:Transcript_70400/g.139668  ORF Transcript_70400/g.139668 Transcript_70400/m.139668 type:complete len:208 (-) Transcript_70400:474-1097(-)|eukprot:CAMPEP_0172690108 /NCGR_PEP_ID=MMETSP1074-20121228/23619_1 /TAXON_ID=2916 /ORGANISM="Ceratium fusus, Strain PA161109" /LENGTH=207 /DNA_ID=CAMNT_0013510013 /DNA_START=77 /DNA_END=700 /DNA_ORIENTATION=-
MSGASADVVFTNLSGFHLYLGPISAAQDVEYLRSIACRHVVTVLQDASDLPEEVERYHVPIKDDNEEHMTPYFAEASGQIGTWLASRNHVLVHCSSGVSRSATIVLAFLITQAGMSLMDAFKHVIEQRPVIQPGTIFFEDLQQLEVQSLGVPTPSLSIAQFYAFKLYSLNRGGGGSASYDSCLDAVNEFGWANDFALLQALEKVSAA